MKHIESAGVAMEHMTWVLILSMHNAVINCTDHEVVSLE